MLAGVALVRADPHQASVVGVGSNPGRSALWYQQPLRILQTVLRETDADGYDVDAVVRYLHEAACNTLVVNAGGIVDFFPHPLATANPSPFLQGRDLLGEITHACRTAGIRVIARVDFRGVEEHVYRRHPDWFGVNEDGSPLLLDYTRPPLHASCYTGHHRNEHAEEFLRYLLTHYPIDGIWHNSIGVGGICHCPRCASAYREAAGASLPRADATPGELERYMRWKTTAAEAHLRRMRRTVRAFGDDKVYTAEVFSMFESGSTIHSGIDLYHARDYFDFLVSVGFLTENAAAIHYEDLHYAGTLCRFLKSMAPNREAVVLYGGNGTAHRYVQDPPLDLQVWLWEALAAGGRFWNCNFTGPHPAATHDRRTAYHGVAAYSFVRDHADLLAHHAPVATVGIYYSRPTRLFYRTPPPEGDRFESAIKGLSVALLEGHIPYDFIPDDQVTPERLGRYAVVLLPNVRCLSARECECLREYVRQGGRLLSTYATSLHDEDGLALENFQLADVFGGDFAGERLDTRRDSYQHIRSADHPLVAPDADATELLLNAGFTLTIRPREGARVVCSLVPRVHNQPPEKAWLPSWPDDYATIIDHHFGAGRALTFANQPDRITHEFGHPDARQLLIRAVRLLAGRLPLESDAPASVHLGLTQSQERPGQYLLSFVNTTSAPVRPLRQLIPVHDLSVRVHLPGRLRHHQILRQQGPCRVQETSEGFVVQLDRLEDFAALHFDLTDAT
jgi:hypothetical protein